ncbi:hypothetical protein ACFSTC_31845 [Nonomuraea ferruginea]
MYRDQPFRQLAQLRPVARRHGQARLGQAGVAAHQCRDLQIPHRLVLEVDVPYPPVQRRRVRGAEPGRRPRAERPHERVGVAPAAVDLHRQVEARLPQPLQQPGRRPVAVLGGGHPGDRRERDHLVHRARPPGQEVGVPRQGEQRELGVRVGVPDRLDAGQRQQEVAERVGAQHRDPPHPGDRAHGCSRTVVGGSRR